MLIIQVLLLIITAAILYVMVFQRQIRVTYEPELDTFSLAYLLSFCTVLAVCTFVVTFDSPLIQVCTLSVCRYHGYLKP